MTNFRKLAHLEEQIGEVAFSALINPRNTGKVKAFCRELMSTSPFEPIEMSIGGRTYEILSVLQRNEEKITFGEYVARAKAEKAITGGDEWSFILEHANEIPQTLRGRVNLMFPESRHSNFPDYPVFIATDRERWSVCSAAIKFSDSIGDIFGAETCVVRRKA
jgi:hypothetical protein